MDASDRRWWSARRATLVAALALALGLAVAVVVLSSGSGMRRRAPAPAPTTTSIPRPPTPPPPGVQLGASVNRLFNDRTNTPANIDRQLRALQQTGATIARSDALWEAAEPSPPIRGVHRYDWTFDDLVAGSLAAHALRWLPIIDYSPSWTQSIPGRDHSPPRSASDYAAYAAALAARYGPGGSFWSAHRSLVARPADIYEIWNEPDNPAFWARSPDPARYAELYLLAHQAIKRVDPRSHVVVGGLTKPRSFLAAMLTDRPELRGQLDGVGIHPYGPDPSTVVDNIRSARLALRSLGTGGVVLYVTEFGWTTHPKGALNWLPERLRPGYIERTLAELGHLDCGVPAALVYTWVTPERDLSNREDWFGINSPGGGATPDAAAFASGLRQATAPGPQVRLCSGG